MLKLTKDRHCIVITSTQNFIIFIFFIIHGVSDQSHSIDNDLVDGGALISFPRPVLSRAVCVYEVILKCDDVTHRL